MCTLNPNLKIRPGYRCGIGQDFDFEGVVFESRSMAVIPTPVFRVLLCPFRQFPGYCLDSKARYGDSFTFLLFTCRDNFQIIIHYFSVIL
jgi:hypothetical protein